MTWMTEKLYEHALANPVPVHLEINYLKLGTVDYSRGKVTKHQMCRIYFLHKRVVGFKNSQWAVGHYNQNAAKAVKKQF